MLNISQKNKILIFKRLNGSGPDGRIIKRDLETIINKSIKKQR